MVTFLWDATVFNHRIFDPLLRVLTIHDEIIHFFRWITKSAIWVCPKMSSQKNDGRIQK
jgi:hypothetical protein